ncbi:MAG: hypothetical protein NVSMB62_26160 [Acidobacteriaceae bacterium]
MSALHERAVLPVADAQSFGAVRSAIEAAFSSPKIKEFLRGMQRTGLRIRDFEAVLHKGLLGTPAAAEYARLNDGDQGQIRELYLATLEKVSPELRSEFFKLYAYY